MISNVNRSGPIGIFDSGVGGLTVFSEIVKKLPEYDYIYLGDNARTPYGSRSFETIYKYTLEAVEYLFDQGCPLIILACNTASAKALKTIQINNLPFIRSDGRVLGIILPTVEKIGQITKTKCIGILSTSGTVNSNSYPLELAKIDRSITIFQEACPMWVPLVESGETDNAGADFFVEKSIKNILSRSGDIDTLLLGCTHYPLLIDTILKYTPENITVLSQGEIVADSLQNYLLRHPEIDDYCTKNGSKTFLTTDNPDLFNQKARLFYDEIIESRYVIISH